MTRHTKLSTSILTQGRFQFFGDGETTETQTTATPKIDENHPEVQAIVAGLKKKNNELLASLKTTRERAKEFEDLNPEEVKEAISAHRAQKDRKLLDEGKVEELLQTRTERLRADHNSQLTAKDKLIKELQETTSKLHGDLNRAVLGSAITQACSKTNVQPTATKLVEKLAGETWKVEDGQLRAYDNTGPIMGKDTRPISMEEWVEGLRTEHGYLFKESYGGDAGTGGSSAKGGSSSARNGQQKRSQMTVPEKVAYVNEHGREAFNKLPY